VLTQWACEVKTRFDLPPQAFVPPPKVWSRVVSLLPRPEPLAPADPAVLHRVVAAAFSQRRKMLRQSLKQLGPAAEPALAAAGIEPTMRAEQLDVAAFCRLSEAFRTLGFDLRMSG
jgi:16S rRNA (adenine1518-N6/adenine1519-N6)-dimethyltransferase